MRRRTFFVFLFLSSIAVLLPGLAGQEFKFPLASKSVRFAAIGDMGSGDRLQYETAQRMVAVRVSFPFDFVIMLGDNIYGGSKPRHYEKKFEVPYKPLLDAGVEFYASLGNHDNATARSYKFYNMDGQSYYSYKRENVRFFVLDSNYMDPAQFAWLEKQLKEAGDNDWKICYFHHPLYSSARAHGSATDLRKLLEPLFVKYGVDVVFAGHDHVYERVHPQQGIHHFVEGASGELRPGNLKRSKITARGYDADCSFILVEITGEDMYFQAVSRLGATVDSGVIRRTPRMR